MTFASSFSIKSHFVWKTIFGETTLFSIFFFFLLVYSMRHVSHYGLSPLRLADKINKCQSSCHLLCLLRRHVNCTPCSIFCFHFFPLPRWNYILPKIQFSRFTDLFIILIDAVLWANVLLINPSQCQVYIYICILILTRNFVLRSVIIIGWFHGNDGSRWRH